jgi:hypothetical protein
MCLAVALSHRSGVPYLNTTGGNVLWVDDIYDQGRTYLDRGKPYYRFHAVWVRRAGTNPPLAYVDTLPQNEWAVFPWEDPVKAERDMKEYLSRG